MRKTAPRPGAPAARSPRSPGTAAPRCEARRRRESGGEGRSYGRKLPTLPQSLERKQKRRQEGQGGEAHHTPDLGPPDSKSEARRTDMRNRALTLLASSTSESVKQRAEVFIQKHQVATVLPEKPQATQALGDDSKPAAVPPDSAPDPSKEEVPSAQPAAKAETSAGTTAPVETQLAQIQRGIFWIFSCVFTCLFFSLGFCLCAKTPSEPKKCFETNEATAPRRMIRSRGGCRSKAKGPEIYEELEKLEKLLRQEAVLISKDSGADPAC